MYGSPSSWMMCTVPPSSATASSSGWSLALLQARWSARLPLVAPIASGEKSEGPGLRGHGKRGVGRGVAATGDAEGAEVAEARPWRTFYPVCSRRCLHAVAARACAAANGARQVPKTSARGGRHGTPNAGAPKHRQRFLQDLVENLH